MVGTLHDTVVTVSVVDDLLVASGCGLKQTSHFGCNSERNFWVASLRRCCTRISRPIVTIIFLVSTAPSRGFSQVLDLPSGSLRLSAAQIYTLAKTKLQLCCHLQRVSHPTPCQTTPRIPSPLSSMTSSARGGTSVIAIDESPTDIGAHVTKMNPI
nr:uncharacterized protein LOC119169100 [Rhipicephalus microplus]